MTLFTNTGTTTGSSARAARPRPLVSARAGGSPNHPQVTVVIPARDEAQTIGATLDSVLDQTLADLEVVVVEGGSVDDTVGVVGRYADRDPRVRLEHIDVPSIPGALNAGLRTARGQWLVRVDAHSTIPSDYVEQAVRRLQTGRWAGVGGRKDGVGITAAGKAVATAMASPFGVGGSTYHHGTAAQTVDHIPFGAYPVQLLRSLGGWDERLAVNEDFELDQRLRARGHELLFDPALRIDWQCRQSIGALFRQYRRYGRGKPQVMRLHPDSTRPRHLMPPALVATLTLALLLLPAQPLLGLAALGAYGGGLGVAGAVASRGRLPLGVAARLPAAFAAMHVGWGIGFWEGVVRLLRKRSAPPRS